MLSGLDEIKVGRATALIFLTNPDSAILVLVRAITAVRDKVRRGLATRARARAARAPARPHTERNAPRTIDLAPSHRRRRASKGATRRSRRASK